MRSITNLEHKLYTFFQESRVESQELRVKGQESRVKSQELRVKSQELRVKSQELRVKRQELRVGWGIWNIIPSPPHRIRRRLRSAVVGKGLAVIWPVWCIDIQRVASNLKWVIKSPLSNEELRFHYLARISIKIVFHSSIWDYPLLSALHHFQRTVLPGARCLNLLLALTAQCSHVWSWGGD